MKPRYRVKAGSRQVVVADLGEYRRTEALSCVREAVEEIYEDVKQGKAVAVGMVACTSDGRIRTIIAAGADYSNYVLLGGIECLRNKVIQRASGP